MMTCTVCGQAMPKARSNQLTCSPKCRTRRYRMALPRPQSGSGRLRQCLMIAQPARFFKLQPDKTYGSLRKAIGATVEQWDLTLDVLNTLWSMLEPIDNMLMWDGETGYTPPSDKPVTDPYLDGLGDVGFIILQELGDLRERLATLHEYRGPVSRVLARHMVELTRLLTELVRQGRQFARKVLAETKPYEVEFQPEFVADLVALQTAVDACWFAVCDQVE